MTRPAPVQSSQSVLSPRKICAELTKQRVSSRSFPSLNLAVLYKKLLKCRHTISHSPSFCLKMSKGTSKHFDANIHCVGNCDRSNILHGFLMNYWSECRERGSWCWDMNLRGSIASRPSLLSIKFDAGFDFLSFNNSSKNQSNHQNV